jgi:heat-inducible transcriptional repressor
MSAREQPGREVGVLMSEGVLTERRHDVLMALVNEYIARALPVGSRTLTDRYDLGFSAATVRSELATLEETGYLTSPHTSAGRVPTDAAYRIFVDTLLSDDRMCQPVRELDDIEQSTEDVDDLVQAVCTTLSRMTNCLSVVFLPSIARIHVKRVSLVRLDSHCILVVLVTESAQVLSTRMSTEEEVDEERVARVESLFNELFSGFDRNAVCNVAHEEVLQAAHDPLAVFLFDAIVNLLSAHTVEQVRHLGVSLLLAQPEFQDARHAIPLVMLLEDDSTLVKLLDDLESDDALSVYIGHETGNEALAGLSIVLKGYASDDEHGVVSVIGPTRMNYAKAIPAVSRASKMFEEVL